jgi:hypothetical protein
MTFAACSNDEVVTEQQNSAADAIGFRTAITNSRAAAVNLDGLKTSGFWVTALNVTTGSDNNSKAWGSTPVQFTWNSTDSKFTSAEDHQWGSNSLEFYASNLDPADGHTFTFPNGSTETDQPKYSDFTPARDIADQVDFVYATNQGSRLDFPGTVPLTFNHALAQIEIRAKYSGTKYKVRCKGYKLVYMYGKNTFNFGEPATVGSQVADNNSATGIAIGTWEAKTTFDAGESAADCWSGFFGGSGYAEDYYADGVYSDIDGGNNNILLNSSYQTINGGVIAGTNNNEGTAMLLPQYQKKQGQADENDKGKGFYIALLVQIDKAVTNTDGSTSYEPYYPSLKQNSSNPTRLAYRGAPKYYGFISVPVEINWEAGKKYIYDLDLSSGFGYADPANPGLADPNDTTYDPKEDRDNNGDDKEGDRDTDDYFDAGDSIIGTPITFTYTVHTLTEGLTEAQGTITL